MPACGVQVSLRCVLSVGVVDDRSGRSVCVCTCTWRVALRFLARYCAFPENLVSEFSLFIIVLLAFAKTERMLHKYVLNE